MPYASDRGDNDEQIKREKEGKMNMTRVESWKNTLNLRTHTHTHRVVSEPQ